MTAHDEGRQVKNHQGAPQLLPSFPRRGMGISEASCICSGLLPIIPSSSLRSTVHSLKPEMKISLH